MAAAFIAIVILVGAIARREAAAGLQAEAEAGLPLATAALRSELEKHRALPLILSQDSAVRALLAAPDPAALGDTDRRLLSLAGATRAAVIYILDADGTAIAASNYREPTSFVGSDYRFRRYYEGAVQEGTAEQYALGTVSNRPGVYFSQRVEGDGGRLLGVVVVKVELAAVEADWSDAGRPVYVADRRGIVLATSVPVWRFRTLQPIGPEAADDIRDSLQFGSASLDPMDLRQVGAAGDVPLWRVDAGAGPATYVEAAAPVEGGLPGWTLHLLVPAGPALWKASSLAQLLSGLTLVLAGSACAFVLRRRRRERIRLAETKRAAAELETRVEQRTAELRDANTRLVGEIAERAKAEARVLDLREDLIQANRLASLGQITAGVAHEINQPLAAIRAYAENAGRFLTRGDAAAAATNLGTVVGLTERIGTITETLRGFSRRATGPAEALAIAEPVEGAILIMRSRLQGSGVRFESPPIDPAIQVFGNRIRLEQVLVNLLRNALEALAGRPDPHITLTLDVGLAEVVVHVADNGPGIAPEILPKLFTPFSTSKPKGLGLGLVISSDIVAEFGGHLSATGRPGEGAHFVIRLKRAGLETPP